MVGCQYVSLITIQWLKWNISVCIWFHLNPPLLCTALCHQGLTVWLFWRWSGSVKLRYCFVLFWMSMINLGFVWCVIVSEVFVTKKNHTWWKSGIVCILINKRDMVLVLDEMFNGLLDPTPSGLCIKYHIGLVEVLFLDKIR